VKTGRKRRDSFLIFLGAACPSAPARESWNSAERPIFSVLLSTMADIAKERAETIPAAKYPC
jgi:hypothetical protein